MAERRLFVACRESYDRIMEVKSYEQGMKIVHEMEVDDYEEGLYSPDFYCVINDRNEIVEG